MSIRIDKVALLNQLRRCSLSDLKNLCFYMESEQPDLRLFYDNLAGETLEDKARELILHLQKYERLHSWGILRQVAEQHFVFLDISFLPTVAELASSPPPSPSPPVVESLSGTPASPPPALAPNPVAEPTADLGIEWVEIPAGPFWMGQDTGLMKNVHRHTLPRFWISKTEITCTQYAQFVAATGYTPPEYWLNGRIPKGKEEHPVVFVSWREAMRFAAWVQELSGEPVTLPSEAEWEKAARGEDKRDYPWGDESDENNAHVSVSLFKALEGTAPVGFYPEGASPYGVWDMSGNVWEWTRSKWGTGWTFTFGLPYDANDGRENYDDIADMRFVIRGGAWNTLKSVATVYVRDGAKIETKNSTTGFRLVKHERG